MRILKARHGLVSQMRRPLPPACRLPKGYRLDVTCEKQRCRECGAELKVGWTARRSPMGIMLGEPRVHKHVKVCKRCGRAHHCRALEQLVPSGGLWCYDVIMTVGQWHWREDMRIETIRERLKDLYGLDVPESTIGDLADRFLDYLCAFHRSRAECLAQCLRGRGGYVCHLDGTCEAGTPTIFMAMAGGCGIVLKTRKMRAETEAQIQKLLESCQRTYGRPVASVSDLSPQIAGALRQVWPEPPHLLCQYHFLRRLGEKLFDTLHRKLTKGLRRCKIAASQRQMRKDLLRGSTGNAPVGPEDLQRLSRSGEAPGRGEVAQIRRYIAYALLLWTADYGADLEGNRYPFDLRSLTFYDRCKQMHGTLEGIVDAAGIGPEEVTTMGTMLRHLSPVSTEQQLVETAEGLRAAKKLFDRLRIILRLDGPDPARRAPRQGTAQRGDPVQKQLEAYRRELREILQCGEDTARSEAAATILEYLDRYWPKLLGHYFTIQTEKGDRTIKVARTNNVMEMLFGEQKRHLRRRMGTANLKRAVAAARPERLLVSNLDRELYVDLLLDGSVDNLVSHFPSCDEQAKKIRQRRANQRTDKPIRLTAQDIRDEDFIDKVTEGAEPLIINIAARKQAA